MNINHVINKGYKHTDTISAQKALNRYKETYRSVSKKMDSLEISSEAYELQNDNEKISATSGKDILEITKGNKENNFVIHFSDSAMVSRAVSRGYITVNAVNIELSDKMKKQLTNVNKQAQADREKAYNKYIMQHELAVVKQQSETLKKAFENMPDIIEILEKILKEGKVSNKEAKKLMEESESISDETVQGISWSDFEWKSFETQMTVSMEKTPVIESITEAEISLS